MEDTDETFTIAGPLVSAMVARRGAELRSLRDRTGRELLWQGDPASWARQAPLLFPLIGHAFGGQVRRGGASHPMPQHGIAHAAHFELMAKRGDACTLRLRDDGRSRRSFPFSFELVADFSVSGQGLRIEARVLNTGPGPMPVSFGFHPGFAWPLPGQGRREDHVLLFAEAETAPIRFFEGRHLAARSRPSPVRGRTLPLSDALFGGGALIFERPASSCLVYGVPGERGIALAWEGCPQLGVWTLPGSGFVCVEPWLGLPDEHGFEGDIFERPGSRILPPCASIAFAMTMVPDVPVREDVAARGGTDLSRAPPGAVPSPGHQAVTPAPAPPRRRSWCP